MSGDLEELMGGPEENFGRSARTIDVEEQYPNQMPTRSLNTRDHEVADALGFGSAGDPSGFMIGENNESNAGMVAHRGVISEREFETMDWHEVRAVTLAKLGVTHEELEFAYSERAGKPSQKARAIRAHVDERLLAISEAGGNMTQLANILLWPLRERPNGGQFSPKMTRALSRAREAREAS